jgi:hypothetical protein
MRRKRTIRYILADTRGHVYITGHGWSKELVDKKGFSTYQIFYNMRQAYRAMLRLDSVGGKPELEVHEKRWRGGTKKRWTVVRVLRLKPELKPKESYVQLYRDKGFFYPRRNYDFFLLRELMTDARLRQKEFRLTEGQLEYIIEAGKDKSIIVEVVEGE